MKVFISADMEGISGVVHSEHTARDGREHDYARLLMTEEVNAAIRGALAAGAAEVLVNDSHGTMRNILIDKLHPAARLITGSPKKLGMMEGIDSSFQAVLFVGYHSRMNTRGVLSHTWHSGVVANLRVNGQDIGETAMNAGIAGVFGVPVVFAAGDDRLALEAKRFIPGIVTAEVKRAVNRTTADCLPPEKARALIEEKVKEALSAIRTKPLVFNSPVRLEVTFLHAGMADNAELMPRAERIDDTTLAYECNDYLEAIRAFRTMVSLA